MIDLASVIETLEGLGHAVINDKNNISLRQLWRSWYKGKVNDFHAYTIYNGDKTINCDRAQFGMAKMLCETWADLIWNSDCYIQVNELTQNENEDKKVIETVIQSLKNNNFTTELTKLIEIMFAEGTAAITCHETANGDAELDYLIADYIYPLKVKKGEIVDCAFVSYIDTVVEKKRRKIAYFMIHEKQDSGYRIRNIYYSAADNGDILKRIAAPDSVKEEYATRTKRFAILKPAIINNTDYQSPFGISVFANSMDNLKNIDLAYDGIQKSMQLGLPRIGVTAELTRIDETGNSKPLFDSNDIVFYYLGEPISGIDGKATKNIEDLTIEYRAKDFEESLREQVNLITAKTGLGENTFNWEEKRIATATQVVSENSVMSRAMRKHQDALRREIITIVGAICEILNVSPEAAEIAVQFDDSVTINRDAEREQAWSEVLAGKLSYRDYLVIYKG